MATSTFTPTNPGGWQSWFDYINQQKQKPEYRGGADLGSSYQYWLKNIRDLPRPGFPMGANQSNVVANAAPTEPVNPNQPSNIAQGWGSSLNATTGGPPPPQGAGEPMTWAGPISTGTAGEQTAATFNPAGTIEFIREMAKKISGGDPAVLGEAGDIIFGAEPISSRMMQALLQSTQGPLMTNKNVTNDDIKKLCDTALAVGEGETAIGNSPLTSLLGYLQSASVRPGSIPADRVDTINYLRGKVKELYDKGNTQVAQYVNSLASAPEMDRWTGKMIPKDPKTYLNQLFTPSLVTPWVPPSTGGGQGDIGKPISPLGGGGQPNQPNVPDNLGAQYTPPTYQPQQFMNDLNRSFGYNQQIPQPPQPPVNPYGSQYGESWKRYL